MARVLSLFIAVAGIGGAIALLLLGKGESNAPGLTELASSIDSRLTEVAAGVHARVTTLADLPRLAAAVSTDAATVANLTQSELAFQSKPNESIEIGQVLKEGKQITLLRIPKEGPPLRLGDPGVHLDIVGEQLILSEVVSVKPIERVEELRGAIAVSWVVPLSSIAARFDALGWVGQLQIGGASVPLGSKQLADGTKIAVPLSSGPAKGAQLVVTVPSVGAGRTPLVAGTIALVSLILSALLWRGASASVAKEVAPGQASSSVAVAPTSLAALGQPSASVAVAPTSLAASSVGSSVGARPGSGIAGARADVGRAGTELAVGAGRQIGRYTVLRPLGAGGMAEVFLARAHGEAGFEKLVALKVLHKHMGAESVIVDHFLDEARLASKLTHPNIVQITDLGRAGDEYFIAMEYIEGSDLDQLLRNCRARGVRVPTAIALTILRKICDGLHAAHTATGPDGKSLELVHRDVKSANVFVARNGAVKVGDFGIAKTTSAGRVARTEVGQVKGTAAYMAPEHRTGEVVDRRADLYAVGAIAYELLSGNEINLDLMVLAHKGKEGWPHLPKLSEIRPDLPRELDAVVWRALAFDKESRFPTCEALETELEAIATKYGLIASDKAVAQFVEGELAAQSPSAAGGAAS